MDLQKSLLALREHAREQEIGFLVSGGDVAFASKMDACIQQAMENNDMGKSMKLLTHLLEYRQDIRNQLLDAGIADAEITTLSSRYGDFGDLVVLPILALVFELDTGILWAPGLVRSKCPDLEFDSDGLLVGPSDTIDFAGPRNLMSIKGRRPVDFSFGCEKTGIAYKNSYVIPFHESTDRYNLGLSDGFLRFLSNFVAENPESEVRVKISQDTLLDMSRFRESSTRAYIRGPKGVSPSKLQSESFPENPRGDLTEHRWVEDGSRESRLSESLFPTEGFQVVWSSNGGIKTCQAEEIVRPSNSSARDGTLVYNRYVHARWDTSQCRFTHFDGAIRGYVEENYRKRATTDIRLGRDLSDCYIKLWRLDGEISFESWADLLVRYFCGHNLVAEYMESVF